MVADHLPVDLLWPSPDQQLLLEAALGRGERCRAALERWKASIGPEQEFGWNALRLLPLLFTNLRQQGVRDPLMGRLRGVYRRAWFETHRLFHRTEPTISRMVANGCDVLLLKGAPLVLSYYRNYALRPMADLDVAVPRRQVPVAIQVLEDAGYRGDLPFSADLLRFNHALKFMNSDGVQIDLHWHVLFETASEAADRAFWAATEPVEFMGNPVRQSDPTTTLLQVVVHGIRWNEEAPIRWIPDAITILRSRGSALDWRRLLEYADEFKLSSRLALGLGYLTERFDAPIPPAVLVALSRRRTLLERVENSVMLADGYRLTRSAFGIQWAAFTEYCRYASPGGALAFLRGYAEYLRFRWNLGGRREIVPWIMRGLGRKLREAAGADGAPRNGNARADG